MVDDLGFETKISQIIRNSMQYWVSYPDAFTAREIGETQNQHILLPLLQDIEKKEYTWEKIGISEREKILKVLEKILYQN